MSVQVSEISFEIWMYYDTYYIIFLYKSPVYVRLPHIDVHDACKMSSVADVSGQLTLVTDLTRSTGVI